MALFSVCHYIYDTWSRINNQKQTNYSLNYCVSKINFARELLAEQIILPLILVVIDLKWQVLSFYFLQVMTLLWSECYAALFSLVYVVDKVNCLKIIITANEK